MLNKDYYILLSMIETIDKIIRYTDNYTNADDFYNSERDYDATMMNFILVGETIDKLTDEVKDKNPQIEWYKIYGLRNIIAHNYFGVNVDTVWQIVQSFIPKLRNDINDLINK
jgi:uncharacterized protein with HEPN domain